MKELKVLDLRQDEGVAVLALDRGLYPLDVIYGASYVLIDRAYMLLDKGDDGRTLVRVQAKDPEQSLQELVGELSNELLAHALRRKVTQQNRAILEAIVTGAIAGATGALVPGSFEDDDDDDLDFLDDPLGIAVPWEEKFSKKTTEAAKPAETTEGTAGPGDSGGFKPTPGEES